MNTQRLPLVISQNARQQLNELKQSITLTSGSESVARNYLRALMDYIEQIPDFPLRGSAFPHHHPDMRIIGFRKTLLIAFLATKQKVVVISILSTRQSRLTLENALEHSLSSIEQKSPDCSDRNT